MSNLRYKADFSRVGQSTMSLCLSDLGFKARFTTHIEAMRKHLTNLSCKSWTLVGEVIILLPPEVSESLISVLLQMMHHRRLV